MYWQYVCIYICIYVGMYVLSLAGGPGAFHIEAAARVRGAALDGDILL